MEIKKDNITGSKVIQLLKEHVYSMKQISPPDSVHALDLEALRKPEITFWSVWDEEELAGCGALKELDANHGEIKSMRTSSSYLRRGVAKQLIEFILEEAKNRGYDRLSLETGSVDAFIPARKLYESFGFISCKPFSTYKEDPNSVFMTKEL